MKFYVGGSHCDICRNLLSADMSEVKVGYRFAYFVCCVFFVIFNYLLYLFILVGIFLIALVTFNL